MTLGERRTIQLALNSIIRESAFGFPQPIDERGYYAATVAYKALKKLGLNAEIVEKGYDKNSEDPSSFLDELKGYNEDGRDYLKLISVDGRYIGKKKAKK